MSASNNFLTDLYYLAAEQGLNADQMLQDAGLARDLIDRPDVRVDSNKLSDMVVSVWDQLQDEAMGLVDKPIPRGAFYMMGKVAIHEPNLAKAINAAIRFYAMVTHAFSVRLDIDEGQHLATLKIDINTADKERYYLFAELNLMAWHRFLSWLISENLAMHEVFFDFSTPAHASEYGYLFPGKHIFDNQFQGFSFHQSFLDKEVSQTNDALKVFVKNCPMEFFMQPKTDFSVSYDLRKLLKKCMISGFPVIDVAADSLHMTKRTLIRKLKEEGTSYQEIKDLIRRDRAIQLLSQHSMPMSEVAEAVGFSDPAVFARAFKNWAGVPPRQYRQTAQSSE